MCVVDFGDFNWVVVLTAPVDFSGGNAPTVLGDL